MCSLAKAVGEPPLCFLRVQQEAKEEAKGGAYGLGFAAGAGGERLNKEQQTAAAVVWQERGQRKATTETAAAWNLEDVEFYTAKVGTTSIRAKAFGEKIRGRSVILRVGGVRVVCSVHRPPERVERVERAAPTHGKTNGRPYERSSRPPEIEKVDKPRPRPKAGAAGLYLHSPRRMVKTSRPPFS